MKKEQSLKPEHSLVILFQQFLQNYERISSFQIILQSLIFTMSVWKQFLNYFKELLIKDISSSLLMVD